MRIQVPHQNFVTGLIVPRWWQGFLQRQNWEILVQNMDIIMLMPHHHHCRTLTHHHMPQNFYTFSTSLRYLLVLELACSIIFLSIWKVWEKKAKSASYGLQIPTSKVGLRCLLCSTIVLYPLLVILLYFSVGFGIIYNFSIHSICRIWLKKWWKMDVFCNHAFGLIKRKGCERWPRIVQTWKKGPFQWYKAFVFKHFVGSDDP